MWSSTTCSSNPTSNILLLVNVISIYKVFDLKNYTMLYSISDTDVQEIKIRYLSLSICARACICMYVHMSKMHRYLINYKTLLLWWWLMPFYLLLVLMHDNKFYSSWQTICIAIHLTFTHNTMILLFPSGMCLLDWPLICLFRIINIFWLYLCLASSASVRASCYWF